MRTWKPLLALVAVVASAALCWQAGAQIKKGKMRLAETKHLMRGVVQANCAACGNLLKDAGPADDAAWEKVQTTAQVLNEISYSLMDDGRCPDGVWAGAATTLRECSAKLAEEAKAKNLAGAQGALKGLVGACAACHGAHKK